MSRSQKHPLIGLFGAVLAFSLAATPALADDLAEDIPLGEEPTTLVAEGGAEADVLDKDVENSAGDVVPVEEDGTVPEGDPAAAGDSEPADEPSDQVDEVPPADDAGGDTEAEPADAAEEEIAADADVPEDPALEPAAETTLNGVDISGHNRGVDFTKLPGDFVIIKATEYRYLEDLSKRGQYDPNKTSSYTTYNDYVSQAKAALANGKLIGFYHFATNPTTRGASISQQADAFVDAVKGYLGNAILVLDWENGSNSELVDKNHVNWAKEWLDLVAEKTGTMPLIYMSKAVTQAYDWSAVANAGYELWGAQYLYRYDRTHEDGYNTNYYVDSPVYDAYGDWGAWGKRPTIYQYSSTGKLAGQGSAPTVTFTRNKQTITISVIDVNIFYGSKADWKRLAKAGELGTTATLKNGAVYSFMAARASGLGIANSSSDAKLGSTGQLDAYWKAIKVSDSVFRFQNVATGRYLGYAGGASSSSNVALSDSVYNWRLVKCVNGAISLIPTSNAALRLDISGGKVSTSGTNLLLYKANGTQAQRFFAIESKAISDAITLGQALPQSQGIYALYSGLGANLSLDIAGGSTANYANAQLYAANTTLAQRFEIKEVGNGLYTISIAHSGKALDVAGGRAISGTNVRQYAGNGSLAQLWYFIKDGSGFSIRSASSGLALDVAGGKTANKTNVRIYSCNGTSSQRWVMALDAALTEALPIGDSLGLEGIYSLESLVKAGMVADIKGASLSNKANLQLYSSNGSLAQMFDVKYVGNGFYRIRAAHSLLSLDAAGGKAANYTNVQQYAGNDTRSQLWYFVKNSDGSYRINSALMAEKPFSLDVQGRNSANGTNIRLYTQNDSTAQRFFLKHAALLDDGTYSFGANLTQGRTLTLEVAGGRKYSGANVQIYQYNGSDAQKWELSFRDSDGSYLIVNKGSGLALSVEDDSKAVRANVEQRAYSGSGSASQRWYIGLSEDGSLTFKNAASNLYLDIAGGKAANGTNVRQYTGNDSAAQAFSYTADPSDLPGGELSKFISNMIYYCDVISMGYDQSNRWDFRDGGECDCSSLVIHCLQKAGFNTGSASYTGNMSANLTANGWRRIAANLADARPGDILLNDSYHTCAVISGYGLNAKIAQASIDENGNISGGLGGDQNGKETNIKGIYTYSNGGWNCILRYGVYGSSHA